MKERAQKVMAHRGMCSRRKAEALIADGKVYVDGTQVTEMGLKVDPDVEIEVRGANISSSHTTEPKVYILLHKPTGYICSTTSDQGKSILELLSEETYVTGGEKAADAWKQIKNTRVYPVGRLDKDSEGLVLLTNDGALANKLTHPRYEHEKEYEIIITGRVPKGAEDVLMNGMDIGEGEIVRGIEIKHIKSLGKRTIVTVILREGKNRQIRRMFGRLGMDVVSLKRTRIDTFNLKTLPVGRWILINK